jgi:outer membrane lipoprotein carrier protein
MKTTLGTGVLLLPLVLAACGGGESAAATRDEAPARPHPAAAAQPAAGPGAVEAGGVVADAVPGIDGATGSGEATGEDPREGVPAAAMESAAPVRTDAAPAASGTPGQDRAAEILAQAERASRAVRSLEADFTQSMSVPLLNQTQRSTGKLYQRRPDRMLMRFSDPEGDVIVADGRHFWLYYPSTDQRQVIRTSIAQGGEVVDLQQQFLSNPNQRFVATLAGEESVGGRAAYVLTLVPRGPSPYRILKIWVDKQDHLVRRFEMTEENDSVRRVELRNLRTNHALPDALFAFTPPPGAQVFDQ